jgi:hypothetical protein
VLLVSGVCDNSPAANEITPNSSYTYVYGHSRINFGPTIVDLEAMSDCEIRIEFNMRISKTSAELVSNYWFNHNLKVLQSKLDDSGRVVYLTTSKHQDGALYTALLNNIAAADNPLDTIRPNSQYFYIFNAEQSLVPKVTEVTALGETFIEVTFSAPVDRVTAENHRNYVINNHMSVLKAELYNSERVVYLETSRHLPAHVYILGISGVKPAEQVGSMRVNSSTAYTYLPQLRLDFLSDAEVQMSYLKVGKEYYVDRNYVVTYVPDYLAQERLVKTSNNDRVNSNNRYIVIQSSQPTIVYVAYDSRVTSVPNWLKNNFTKTEDYIGVSDLAKQLILWKRTFAAGEAVLGGNNATGTEDVKNMYIVLVVETQGRGLRGDNELEGSEEQGSGIPHAVELFQNYPNPFNQQTYIYYKLPSPKQVTVTVYNILGRKVKELFNGSADVGHHKLMWNGTDEHGNPVGAGIYFCRMVCWDVSERNGVAFIQNYQTIVRKMTLLK